MIDYLRSVKDRRNAIVNDTDSKFCFESQKFSDILNYRNLHVQNPVQTNGWAGDEVRKYKSEIDAAAARYSIDPDIVTTFSPNGR